MKAIITPPLLREMRDILIVAAVLGIAYNFSSPLGVNLSKPGPAPGTAAAPASPAIPTLRSLANPSLHNETITAVVIPVGDRPGKEQGSGGDKLLVAMAWAEVKPLLMRGRVTLVDARPQTSYDAGHIPGAISLPWDSLDGQIGQFADRYPKTTPLVVYCESVHCAVAHNEAVELSGKYGFQDVREMPGGIAEWRLAGSSAAVVSMQAH